MIARRRPPIRSSRRRCQRDDDSPRARSWLALDIRSEIANTLRTSHTPYRAWQPHSIARVWECMLTKRFKYKLRPNRAQKRALGETLALCRERYNAAVSEQREIWRRRGMSLGYYKQKAELPDLKRALSEYASVHAQVLQDVILRVERTFSVVSSGPFPCISGACDPARYQAIRASREMDATGRLQKMGQKAPRLEPGDEWPHPLPIS